MMEPSARETIPDFGIVNAVPYGGMFFNKLLLNKIGFPDETFYIYSDGTMNFHTELHLARGDLILSLKSHITDIEDSWNINKSALSSIIDHTNPSLLYYSIRNRVYLECMHTVNNRLVYGFKYAALPRDFGPALALCRMKLKNLRVLFYCVL